MNELGYLVGSGLLLVAVVAAAVFYRRWGRVVRENDELAARLERMEAERGLATAQAVKYKLDPHLLKNALNAIQSHAYQSYFALDKLSNVLDYILYEADNRMVPLKDEIAFAQNLIEINRLKVSPLFDLHIRMKIDAAYEQVPIAPMITINPIENAFKHADVQQESAFISVIFEAHDDTFRLSVSNKIPPTTAYATTHHGGIGDTAYKARLTQLYGDNYTLETRTIDDIYHVTLEIKLA